MYRRYIAPLFLLSTIVVFARQEVLIPDFTQTPNEQAVFYQKKQDTLSTAHKKQKIALNDEDLLANPLLFSKILDQSVQKGQWSIVEHLIPLYESLAIKDDNLLLYAKSRLAFVKGRYKDAISGYRQLLEKDATLGPVRLYLVQALFQNKEYEAASFQLDKLRATPYLPRQILSTINQYTLAIQKKNDFQWSVSLNYIDDDNINETSSDKYIKLGSWIFERSEESLPKHDRGIGYALWMQKNINLKDNHVLVGSLSMYGKTYKEYDEYDDFVARASFGYRWEDATKSFILMPFFQKRLFGNNPYSQSWGTRTSLSYLWSRKFQNSFAVELGKNSYDERTFLDGWYSFGSFGASYSFSPSFMLFGGIDQYDNHTKERSESFTRSAIRIGFAKDMPFAFSTKISANYANKVYDDAPNIYGIQRHDKEYSYDLSLWKRDWYFWGVMPKINLEYTHVKSNINIFAFDKNRVYFSFDRRF
ncbi:MAG: porin family protein [Sulfurovaceae bacterium]